MAADLRIGCAGWSLPKAVASAFPGDGSHLQRYARVFNAVEINSSFYRPHRAQTYARWADEVPEDFRFAVKMPRAITHDARLEGIAEPLDAFLEQCTALAGKLGCLLIQLPPSFAFDADRIGAFLALLRSRYRGAAVLEPRHRSWFEGEGDALLADWHVGRVAADPAIVPRAGDPGGDPHCAYFRLHGSPDMYASSYGDAWLEGTAARLRASAPGAVDVWCVFDNTARGAAIPNALTMTRLTSAD